MSVIFDPKDECNFISIVQKHAVRNRLAAVAGMVISILRAYRDNVSTEDVGDLSCSRADMSLSQLAKSVKTHDGHFGVCFELCMHDGISNKTLPMYDYVRMTLRGMFDWDWPIESVIYGVEKRNPEEYLDKFDDLFGEDPMLVTRCHPATPLTRDLLSKLRTGEGRDDLPKGLKGLHKADLFLGNRDKRLWTSASVKSASHLTEEAPGLALIIYPCNKNKEVAFGQLMLYSMGRVTFHLPIPTEDSFMDHFRTAFRTVEILLEDKLVKPQRRYFPDAVMWWIADFLYVRRKHRLADVETELAVHADPQETVYLPRKIPLLTDPDEVWSQLPHDFKENLIISAAPIFAESPILKAIFKL